MGYIRTSSLALFCFSPSSISSVFRYSAHKYKVSQNISDYHSPSDITIGRNLSCLVYV